MIKPLNKTQIDYIFFHLDRHINIEPFKDIFAYGDSIPKTNKPFIYYPLSKNNLVKDFRINDLPVLYPLSSEKEFYYFDSNNNLIFIHDLIKSAFYLLSGYQETQPFKGDHLRRFTYHDSIQKELEIAQRPLVNEYFEIIITAIKKFCSIHKIEIKEHKPWADKTFGLFLTHDVDRVDKWTLMEIKTRTKMVIRSGFLKHWAYWFEAVKNNRSSENPYWNFEWMKDLERKYAFNSTWFFLPQGHRQIDAYYSFEESRIKELASYLTGCGDEIALHGTYNSRENPEVMADNLIDVQKLSSKNISKSRQHWLSFKYPQTLHILEDLQIKYDSSWGFAEHCGWRNSYCCPFHPYDLENDRMMNVQELPLNAMDVTFFQYMGLSLEEAFEAVKDMLETCKKYNGLFVFLWHNSHFNETQIPGITLLYERILKSIADYKPALLNDYLQNEVSV